MPSQFRDSKQDAINRRAEKVRSLRLAGFTYPQISEKVQVGIDTVKRDWERMQVEFPALTTRELVAEQNDKLVEMMKPHYLRAISGDVKATATMLKLMDHQAKLFGLYEPELDTGQATAVAALTDLVNAINGAATPVEGA